MEGGPPGFTRDFTCPALLRYKIGPLSLRIQGYHLLWLHLSRHILLASAVPRLLPYNPRNRSPWFRLIRFRSPLLAESRLLSLPPGTEMFHFPGLTLLTLCIQMRVLLLHRRGFPHSDISGSAPVCGSPKLFAAYHVLHRLLAPRHPPYALNSLTLTV